MTGASEQLDTIDVCTACKCDACESGGAAETPASCDSCGGRAVFEPLCLSCTGEALERAIDVVRRSLRAGSPWLGRELLRELEGRKAQLPTGTDRARYWAGSMRRARP